MNTIQLPVAELKAVLPGLNKVISRRTTLPVLGCIRVERNLQGEVSLQATDLDDHVSVRLKDPIPGDVGVCLVPWEPLAKAIKNSSSEDTITLLDEGKKGLRLRTFIGSSPVDQKLEAIGVNEWPPLPVVKAPGIKVDLPLREALRQAFECSSEDESRLIFNTAYLDVSDPKAHYVVGTNGRALFSANSFTFDLKESLVVPRRKLLGWAGLWESEQCWLAYEPGLAKGPGKVKEPGWVQFRTDRWTLITRQIDGNYVNWRQIVPSASPRTTIKLSQAALESLIEVLPKLPGKDDINSPVTLLVANEHLQVQARGKSDEHRTTIPIDGALITGPGNCVSVNREYLLRALRFGLGDLLLFDPTENVMVCQAPGKRLIIALLQPDPPPTPPPPSTPSTNKPTTTNERTDMSKTTANTTTTETPASETAVKKVIEQIEKIKDTLKGVLSDFNDVLVNLKTAEKEKKATEKEIESIRATLRSLQKVQI
jgi:DNA polymerase III sliding clamp (beta) subunit (PCNA family)